MLLTAGFMAFATFAAKALGQVRDSLMAAYFGAGFEADAFMLASKIPTTLFDVVSAVLYPHPLYRYSMRY